MAEKYISKVRIGSENFVIRDKGALAEAQAAAQAAQAAQAAADAAQNTADHITVPVNGVTGDITFKDANHKMYKLSLVDKKVKLVAVTYNAPTASITAASWNGVNASINSGNATLSRYVDQDGTGSVTGNITGSITTANASRPTVSGASGPTVGNSASPWSMGGTAAVGNNASVTINYTAQGSTKNPSTNAYDTKTCTFTISRTATITSGVYYYASATTPNQNITGGFKFNFDSNAVTPTTQTFGDNKTVKLITNTAGYIYIFTNSAKSFVMSTDQETVDSAKLGGGIVNLGTVKTYSISKTYYVYRSKDSFVSGANVYVKAIV